jgi:PKD repeat protein
MEFTSYQLVGNSTGSLNTGSYLNQTDRSLFFRGYTTDLWYGFSVNDAIELGVWDRSGNFIGWNTLNQSKSYTEIKLSYLNTLNFPTTYSYFELNPDFLMYKNEKILVNPAEELSASFAIPTGSYFLTYNFSREMAGSISSPLIIKEISPSRKELKIVPVSSSTSQYEAFCNDKILLQDASPLYLQTVKNCPYGQIYNQISPNYQPQINTIKSVFFLNTDGAMITFLRNLYEDIFVYTSTPVRGTSVDTQTISGSAIRIQGIQTYFTNYLLSNSNKIVNFADIDNQFKIYVSASIERKFAPIGNHPSQQYVDAKIFVYDFFTTYFFIPISTILEATYREKYYAPLKNALNLGNNILLPIINSGVMDERISLSDPLTLLIKLQTELPNDIMAQTPCWVSNISLTPYVVNAIVKSPSGLNTYKIGPANFSLPIPNASLTNTNLSYAAEDLQHNDEIERELTVSRNIKELSVDYTDFNNFVIFSLAEFRLKIFKNKMTTISTLSSSIQVLNTNNSSSNNLYPYYTQEYTTIQGQINDIINSFDGYESYLYRSGNYTIVNGNFISSSYVAEMDNSASYYDQTNRDSLINNCPQHIISNPDNDDYIVFLSMVGHFFDEIYIYISNIPSQRIVGNSTTEEFTRRIVDYMLETFGWNLDDSLEQSNLINNYLNSDQQEGLNSLSAEDRLKTIRNRILINLPQIYKTKGTEEAVRLILACYGIPSALLSIREYGGINYTDDTAAYTTYERVYMRQWNTSSINDNYHLLCPTGSKTFLFKVAIDSSTPYTYGNEQILFGKVNDSDRTTISGSGEWAVGFVREPKQNTGKMFFRIGYKGYESFKMYSSEFPLFNGNIYSVMLRRNSPDIAFEYTSNVDSVPAKYDLHVQRSESGNEILKLTSSKVCYDTASTIQFGAGGPMNIIGWFSSHNGQGYNGIFDKFQIWNDPVPDSNFTDYVNNINAYSYSGSTAPHKSLLFRMHTDYPFDQKNISWQNANPYYATGSDKKLGDNVDYMTNTMAWSGSTIIVYNTSSCQNVSQSVYPFQFKVIDYPSTWGISKYGPNKFRNEKIRHVSQSVEARFDDTARSTHATSNTAPDSNQVGFFVDPQDFKNRDIIRYFGNYDFMDAIGDPGNQYSSSYTTLNLLRNQYKDARNQLSGSRTLFNELCIIYKLYFNRSIFEAIKNVIPARTNTFTGVIIEPTILERPKYEIKPIVNEVNSGSVSYFDITASHYFRDPNTKLLRFTTSIDLGDTLMDVNASYIALPTRDYPVNFGGNCIGDTPDKYEIGNFAGGVLTDEYLNGLLIYPTAYFTVTPTSGYPGFIATFTNLSNNSSKHSWSFEAGYSASVDNNSSNPVNYTYNNVGIWPSSLKAENGPYSITVFKNITVLSPVADFTATPTIGSYPLSVIFTNSSQGATGTTYDWNFGDSTAHSTLTNPTHIYSLGGTHTVTLTTTYGTYIKTKTSNITVVKSAFTAAPTSGDYNLLVIFTNSSLGATSYRWNFGDGAISTLTNPTHTYTAEGYYTVTLTAINGTVEHSTTTNIHVTAPIIVTANFDAVPNSGISPLIVTFANSSTNGLTYLWNFGDLTPTSTLANPTHTYNNTGLYTVTLTAYNGIYYGTTTRTVSVT